MTAEFEKVATYHACQEVIWRGDSCRFVSRRLVESM